MGEFNASPQRSTLSGFSSDFNATAINHLFGNCKARAIIHSIATTGSSGKTAFLLRQRVVQNAATMLSLILFEPEIPPNTGNIIRLCANTGTTLHLIRPLGFELDEPRLRRAGLDYREFADIAVHDNLDDCLRTLGGPRVFAISTRGATAYSEARFKTGDALLFGPETRGLPQAVLDSLLPEQTLRLPMRPGNRSLNLSNAAAVVTYEAWRQLGFTGGK